MESIKKLIFFMAEISEIIVKPQITASQEGLI